MQVLLGENQILLRGRVAQQPELSHENHSVIYDKFLLAVPRLSGAEDRLNVVLPRTMYEQLPNLVGAWVEVQGEVRSFNNRTGEGSRLVITVLARSLVPAEAVGANELKLRGVLCKPPILRRTPLGREICDLMLAVNRKYGRVDYLPCIAWGVVAERCGNLGVGDCVRLDGRLQSRTYQKVLDGATQERTAFEVSAMQIARVEASEGED